MLNYTITEEIRSEIMHMLEWAEYGINEQKAWHETSLKANWEATEHVYKRYMDEMDKQMAALGVLWDAINALQPVNDE